MICDEEHSFTNDLFLIQRNIVAALEILEGPSVVAQNVENGSYCEYDFKEALDGSMPAFMMETYFYSIPSGVAKRR